MQIPRAALVPVLAVLAVACSSGGGTPTPDDPTPKLAASAPGATPGAPSGGTLPPAGILEPVLADAASRTGAPADGITVVSSEEVQWPDGSLGCPQPGMMYTQAIVDGYRIVVRAGEREIDYRVSGPGRFRVCGPG